MTFHTSHPQVHALHLVMAVVIFFSYLRATVHTKVKMDERMKLGFKGAPPSSPAEVATASAVAPAIKDCLTKMDACFEAAFGGIKKVQDFFIQKASQTGGTTG